ncbi:spirocyclase AveC family protein [Conexibacter sp. SYSU D00693]|uniref:spirocyclase AveC family protein n=1 Tax=Conexibacter sp. SYSU D00693 TaxID=2812560 RepID=UPI00196B0D23|nr:spirocyclase AveC family protein [Conexibacter sp. SYSU D00693]
MAVAVDRPAPSPGTLGPPTIDVAENRTPPVKFWALLGAVILAFIAYVIISWVTGPYFERVEQGPSDPPTWMQVELILWQVVSLPAAAYLLYRFVWRPWRRERTVGVDGVLLLGFSSLWFQDVLSSSGGHWFVYNTSMLNFGSWANSIPWWTAYGEPGAMTSEPILFTPAAYVYIMILAAFLGCKVMKAARARWPQLGSLSLIFICYLAMCLFDLVLEGIIWLPLGVFEYPGGHWSIFPDSYHKYPLNEMLTVSATFTVMASLRFFLDDRGRTVVERGVDHLRLRPGRSVLVRALAVTAAVHLGMFLTYNVPNTFIGMNSTPWPEDLQKRSYFTNNLCGEGTDRPCPGPGVPHIRDQSAYPNTEGTVTPGSKGDPLPAIIPFDRGAPGGSE